MQRAISAQQVFREKKENMVIPVPEAESNVNYYSRLYKGEFKQPKQFIHIQRKFIDTSFFFAILKKAITVSYSLILLGPYTGRISVALSLTVLRSLQIHSGNMWSCRLLACCREGWRTVADLLTHVVWQKRWEEDRTGVGGRVGR